MKKVLWHIFRYLLASKMLPPVAWFTSQKTRHRVDDDTAQVAWETQEAYRTEFAQRVEELHTSVLVKRKYATLLE